MMILLIVGLIRNVSLYKKNYFPEPLDYTLNKTKVKLNLANYATKSDLKKSKSVDTSKFSKKNDLASLKSDVDELQIDKLKTPPVD